MLTDTALRTKVKTMKIFEGISYKTFSKILGIKQNSFYGWLKGNFNLSDTNKRKLEQYLAEYKE